MQKLILYIFLLFSSALFANSFDQNSVSLLEIFILFSFTIFIFTLYTIYKIKTVKKEIESKLDFQEEINRQQNKILSEISEDIQKLANENITLAKKLAHTNKNKEISQEINSFEDSENQLLSISTNLIEFLRIKSKKTKILEEKFSLSNLLNDVSGMIKSVINNKALELHYIVDSKVSEYLIGDTLNLSKILSNIIFYSIEKNSTFITLDIIISNENPSQPRLFCVLQTNVSIELKNPHSIFTSEYDEKTGKYNSLGLYIARELALLMKGELVAKSSKNGTLEFIFDFPYYMAEDQKDFEQLTARKNILALDRSQVSLDISQNILKTLGHSIDVEIYSETTNIDFSRYDMIVVDSTINPQEIFKKISTDHKVLFLTNLFGVTTKEQLPFNNSYTLKRPLTIASMNNAINALYKEHDTDNDLNILPVYKDEFEHADTITLDKFAQFRESNILLVEDNIINQKVVQGILGKSGINITTANDGQEALRILNAREKKFNIILMDINMPVMDGYTASKHIRSNKNYNTLPIVALSALTSKHEIESMFVAGMNGYLAKPLKKEQLFSALSLFITDKKVERRKSSRYEKDDNKLEGLNIKQGILNSNNSDLFYKEILHEFRDAYNESDIVFNNLVNDFRYEQLRLLCLDVRGLAGSIGAEDMNKLTTEVLKLLVFKKYDILKDFVSLYQNSLQKLNKAIDEYLQKS